MIAFLVNWICDRRICIRRRKIHMLNLWGVRSVIATGVASQQHGIWKTDGYQWWNALGREFVAYVTKSINRRLLVQFFDIWWIITGVPRVNSFAELQSARCRRLGEDNVPFRYIGLWCRASGSWWTVLLRIREELGGVLFRQTWHPWNLVAHYKNISSPAQSSTNYLVTTRIVRRQRNHRLITSSSDSEGIIENEV